VKKIAYLLGAGVTQAEANFARSGIQVLTSQIKDGIQIQLEGGEREIKDNVSNDLTTPGVDIEQLISLYESTGTEIDTRAAEYLRAKFMLVLGNSLRTLDTPQAEFVPVLISALLELHSKSADSLEEELVGVLSLNYDDFAERALANIFPAFSYGFELGGRTPNDGTNSEGTNVFLLKLHGSFNWSNDFPPKIVPKYHDDPNQCLWLPPGVEKSNRRYPFSILWGKAREVLDCDVLRVIGCSLSRNDWQLISLLHSAKRTRNLTIEYIDFEDIGEQKEQEYPYLGIVRILKIDGFRKFLSDETGLRDSGKSIENFAKSENAAQFNCFHYWLMFKKNFVLNRGLNFDSSKYIKQI
jgi:hypothetical protein